VADRPWRLIRPPELTDSLDHATGLQNLSIGGSKRGNTQYSGQVAFSIEYIFPHVAFGYERSKLCGDVLGKWKVRVWVGEVWRCRKMEIFLMVGVLEWFIVLIMKSGIGYRGISGEAKPEEK